MKYPLHMSPKDVNRLKYEVVSLELRVYLTRLLDKRITDYSPKAKVCQQNVLVNKSRALLGLDQFLLPPDEDIIFDPTVQVWHAGEFQVILRRLDTIRLVEFLADLIENDWFGFEEINELLERDGVSYRYRHPTNTVTVEVFPIERIEQEPLQDEHPNIRLLVRRMDNALENSDFPAVLHTSASIFETMAKDVIGIESVQNQTLGSFFQRYRQDSLLPDEILDYILAIYDERGSSPLAAHGSTHPPDINEEYAIVLSEMTKAFVQIEYWRHQARTNQSGA